LRRFLWKSGYLHRDSYRIGEEREDLRPGRSRDRRRLGRRAGAGRVRREVRRDDGRPRARGRDRTVMKGELAALVARRNLRAAEMTSAMSLIMDGEATPAKIGSFLTALRSKGETVEELVAAVQVLRERAVALPTTEAVIDTCGTGGDGLGMFNVSTGAAFVAAAAGAKVAKHGNRAASGKVGAADVLEAAGAIVELGPEQAKRCLDRCGITFLFAPTYHPAVRHVAAVRRELGFRTLFNLTGPLSNPAGAKRQVIGLFSREWLVTVAEVLRRLGSVHVL